MVMPNPKSAVESATSSLAIIPTIDEIHDRSEHEKDSPNKTSMKNVLYEPGIYMTSCIPSFILIRAFSIALLLV